MGGQLQEQQKTNAASGTTTGGGKTLDVDKTNIYLKLLNFSEFEDYDVLSIPEMFENNLDRIQGWSADGTEVLNRKISQTGSKDGSEYDFEVPTMGVYYFRVYGKDGFYISLRKFMSVLTKGDKKEIPVRILYSENKSFTGYQHSNPKELIRDWYRESLRTVIAMTRQTSNNFVEFYTRTQGDIFSIPIADTRFQKLLIESLPTGLANAAGYGAGMGAEWAFPHVAGIKAVVGTFVRVLWKAIWGKIKDARMRQNIRKRFKEAGQKIMDHSEVLDQVMEETLLELNFQENSRIAESKNKKMGEGTVWKLYSEIESMRNNPIDTRDMTLADNLTKEWVFIHAGGFNQANFLTDEHLWKHLAKEYHGTTTFNDTPDLFMHQTRYLLDTMGIESEEILDRLNLAADGEWSSELITRVAHVSSGRRAKVLDAGRLAQFVKLPEGVEPKSLITSVDINLRDYYSNYAMGGDGILNGRSNLNPVTTVELDHLVISVTGKTKTGENFSKEFSISPLGRDVERIQEEYKQIRSDALGDGTKFPKMGRQRPSYGVGKRFNYTKR